MPRPPLLTAATLNLRHNADDWERRAPLCVAGLAERMPHLIALQEVWFPVNQSRWLAEQLNQRLKPGEGRYAVVDRTKWGFEEYLEGVSVLTRLPMVAVGGVDLPGGRVATAATVRWGERLVEFVSVHIHFGPVDGIRRAQINAMEAWLKARWGEEGVGPYRPPTIIAGDFNATPESAAVQLMREDWRSAYETVHGSEPEWTYGTPLADRVNRARGAELFHGTLDYLFVSHEFRVAGASLFCDRPSPDDPELFPSDHLGVLAELELDLHRPQRA